MYLRLIVNWINVRNNVSVLITVESVQIITTVDCLGHAWNRQRRSLIIRVNIKSSDELFIKSGVIR